MVRTRRTSFLATALALLLTSAACGGDDGDDPGAAPADDRSGGSYSAFIIEPNNLVPQNVNESEGNLVLSGLFTGLVEYDPETNQPVNAMAESIETDDQKTFTIRIKDGWTFHDGTPVTAQSFVDAWNFGAYAPNAQNNSYFFEKIAGYADLQGDKPKSKTMSGLRAVDATTLEVTLSSAFSQFPITLGYNAFYPMPEVAFTDMKKYNEAPVGNGPFKMDGTWVHNEYIKMVRFEDYKGDAARADAVELRIYSDVGVAFTDLEAGNLDIVDEVGPEQVLAARDHPGGFEAESSSFTYIGFPLYDKRFQNRDLREAFSRAIDRKSITEKIYFGARVPASSLVSPVVAGYREGACEHCTYDPEGAKELFDKAGGFDGPLTLWFNNGAGHDIWMQSVANNLRSNLGIQDIQFRSLDFAQYNPLLDQKKVTGPFRLGWGMDYPSPQNYLEPLYSTTGSSNNFGYSNPEVDRLLAEGNAAASVDAGIEKYHEAEDLILADVPIIPMWFSKLVGAHSDRVSNVVVDAYGNIRLADVTVAS